MRLSAGSQRVFAVAVSGIFLCFPTGCAVHQASESEFNSSPDLQIEDQVALNDVVTEDAVDMLPQATGNIQSFLRTRSESSEELVALSEASLGMEVLSGEGVTRVLVQTGEAAPLFNVSELDNPGRLVLDFPNSKGKLNRIFEISDSSHISRVRVGAHEDKERVVFDLVEASDVSHQIDVVDGVLVLSLSDNLALAANDIADFVSVKAQPGVEAFPEVDEAPVMAAPEMEATDPELTPHLTGLAIESLPSGGNQIVADVTSAGALRVKRTAASEHVVILEGAVLDENASNALVAPAKSGLIRSVRPIQKGNDVFLRIFSAPESEVTANTRGGKIFISAMSHGGPMAQADIAELDDGDDAGEAVADNPNEDELRALLEGEPQYTGRLISLDLQDTDIDNALRIIAEVSNLNIIASDDVTGKVTLRLIDVPWDQALDVILKTNGLDKVQEGNVIRVAPVDKLRAEREALKEAIRAQDDLAPLLVRYIRISYSKASDLKPLVEAVLTERGSVAVDERTNQIIVKDIQKGIEFTAVLVKKLDLRTPQVLLETQIIEAQRNFLRDLGAELGYDYVKSPETGNATSYNFPNSVELSGGVVPGSNTLSSFPAALGDAGGSAVNLLLGSADGTQNLDIRISALESQGRIRVVSRPSVATINNKQAIIKSVEKIRVRTPDSGLSVATGQGAQASGGAAAATETFEVGITLEVTPQASPDYYVLLDIDAKSSTLGATVVDGIPSEVERSATSTVLVSSGQTFALGGIYKITDQDSVDGTPFFKDVPVIGHLFRRSLVDNGDEELIFFITPRIVEGSFDDAAMMAAAS